MAEPSFQFKQFTVQQDRCSMKVGTDGVLLGAWVRVEDCSRILDIGAGTGLIALMLAQRSKAKIDCLEIDPDAASQATENCNASKWGHRLTVHPVPLQTYKEAPGTFDLLVSNPPFFINSTRAVTSSRSLARQNDSLPAKVLIEGVKRLLSAQGRFAVILPVAEYNLFCREALQESLFEVRRTHVLPTPEKDTKRVLAEFAFQETECICSQIVVEKYGRHGYSEEYIQLTKDFYLKF